MRLLLFAALLAASAAAQSPLCTQLQAITAEPALHAAHWGISVTALDGSPVCNLNDEQLFRPASAAKLFTVVVALNLLDGKSSASTELLAPLENVTGDTVASDLILRGHGDAFLSDRPMPFRASTAHGPRQRNPLEAMADTLARQGVHRISGDIVGDDTDFPYQPIGADWSAGDTLWGYGAPVSALSLEDNKVTLTVNPAAGLNGLAPATLNQLVPYYQVRSDVRTVAAHAPAAVLIERQPGSRIVRVTGTVALGASYTDDLAIDDPALYAAMYLKALLQQRGLIVDGAARAQHRPLQDTLSFAAQQAEPPRAAHDQVGPFPVLPVNVMVQQPQHAFAIHTSPTLLEDITLTLKVSQNLHAELLLHRLGRLYGSDGSTGQGCRVVRQWLLWKGDGTQPAALNGSTDSAALNPDDFYLNDGSGLSTHDLVAPRAFTQLLVYAARQPWFADFKAALPLAGVDGTLAARFTAPDSALKGRVFAKTGTLGESRALTGYITAASGRTVVFAIMEDTHLPGAGTDRQAIDRMVELIASQQ